MCKTTSANKQNTDAPFGDMTQLKLWKQIAVFAQPASIALCSITAGCGVLLTVICRGHPEIDEHAGKYYAIV